MDNLTETLSAGPQSKYKCQFKAWLDELSEEDQLSVKKSLIDPAWNTRNLFDTLKKFGLPTGREGLVRHRTGSCSACGPV